MQTLSRTTEKPLSVLVVDTSRTIRRIIFKVLDECALPITKSEAENGPMAYRLSRSIPFDIIFIDCCMPIMGGIECTRKIHKYRPKAKIILMTTQDQEGLNEEAMRQIGLTAVLRKPFFPDDIDKVLGIARSPKVDEIETSIVPVRTSDNEEALYGNEAVRHEQEQPLTGQSPQNSSHRDIVFV